MPRATIRTVRQRTPQLHDSSFSPVPCLDLNARPLRNAPKTLFSLCLFVLFGLELPDTPASAVVAVDYRSNLVTFVVPATDRLLMPSYMIVGKNEMATPNRQTVHLLRVHCTKASVLMS